MKKTILSFLLIFTILFNTYSLKPAYADPVTIGVTSYEVYTYITLVLTYLGVEFKNAQERQRWIEDEYGPYENPDGGFYDIIDYQIRRAKADAKFGTEPPKPEPRQIAIPVPDNIIDNLYNKLKDLVYSEPEIPADISAIYSDAISRSNGGTFYKLLFSQSTNRYYVYIDRNNNVGRFLLLDSSEGGGCRFQIYGLFNGVEQWVSYSLTRYEYSSTGNYITAIPKQTISASDYSGLIYENDNTVPSYEITLPTGNFNLNWTSPYTGMQTVTMPLTTTGIESPVEIPVIPGEYVEPVPDEVTNPITQPVTDPLINPETGLPFIGPDGLPIFPSVPLVPTTPVTPIPAPEALTQPKDYTPNLTEISNGIKQLPERIINPIKKLFVPDTVSKIDFSPLNVPITRKFPFCIPWDLRDAVVSFSAPPVPPVFTFSLTFFGEFAEITRFFVLIGFVVGLILITRGLIKG